MVNNMKNLELENESDEQDDTGNASDEDSCNFQEIKTTFNKKSNLITEKQRTDNKYILHIDGTNDSTPNIAVATTESSVDIYQFSERELINLYSLEFIKETSCIGVKFCPDNNNLIYTGYNNGNILLWDLRTPTKYSQKFNDETCAENAFKPFSCFDVSTNNRLITAGTELYVGDAFILFWDVRNVKLMGGYWESHTDDVTQVKIHPEDPDKLISSSTDGLINVYDLSQTNEDDALLDSLNTESSVEHINWFKNGNLDAIICATHTNDVQLWKLEDAEPYIQFKRNQFGKEIKRTNFEYTYIANSHTTSNNDLVLLIGSNYKNGACLRGLTAQKDGLRPAYNFENNKQCIRATWFNKYTNILITGGEQGILNVWDLDTNNLNLLSINN